MEDQYKEPQAEGRFAPHMVFYTNDYVKPHRHQGRAIGPFIFIRPDYRDNRGLLEHEIVHAAQWWRYFCIGKTILRLIDRNKWVLRWEVEAYREQLRWSPGNEDLFAGWIANTYGLKGVTVEEAAEATGVSPLMTNSLMHSRRAPLVTAHSSSARISRNGMRDMRCAGSTHHQLPVRGMPPMPPTTGTPKDVTPFGKFVRAMSALLE